jgi:post-segregation antitoxin (ccd killing protein)
MKGGDEMGRHQTLSYPPSMLGEHTLRLTKPMQVGVASELKSKSKTRHLDPQGMIHAGVTEAKKKRTKKWR